MTKTYENIRKIATGQGDYYTTGCLLEYPHFKNHYKTIAIDLSKAGNTTMFFIIEETKETVFEFSLGTVKVL